MKERTQIKMLEGAKSMNKNIGTRFFYFFILLLISSLLISTFFCFGFLYYYRFLVFLLGNRPIRMALQQLPFGGCLGDLSWAVGPILYVLSAVVTETEATAMMFLGSDTSSMEVAQDDIWRELDPMEIDVELLPVPPANSPAPPATAPSHFPEEIAEDLDLLSKIGELEGHWVTNQENALGDLILEFLKEEHMRAPAPNRLQRIVEMLEERHGVEKLPEMLSDLKENRLQSRFYKETKSFYNELRGASEDTLEKFSYKILD